jgi:phospholipase/carboxylesterase
MAWFRDWLDDVAPAGRPVVLVGFSGGAAFAGGLLVADPDRFAGAAILYGTLPFDAGVPVTSARLVGVPVFVAQGDSDTVIPRELLDRTWSYLLAESGAPTVAHRRAGGHQLTAAIVHELGDWIGSRSAFLDHHRTTNTGPVAGARWPTFVDGELPARSGPVPDVSWTIPQQQESDNAPAELQEALFARMSSLPGVESGPSRISVPGARAVLAPEATGAEEAFLVPSAREFAHLHPSYDGSLHLVLPRDLAADAVAKGWAQVHMLAGIRLSPGFVLVYGPRNGAEVDVVAGIVEASHRFALGG